MVVIRIEIVEAVYISNVVFALCFLNKLYFVTTCQYSPPCYSARDDFSNTSDPSLSS